MHISPQGLIRITYEALNSTSLVHLLSGVDADEGVKACGRLTELTGFTEWVSQSVPVISIGWDWRIVYLGEMPLYERLGLPRTNVLILDDSGRDRVWDDSLMQLCEYVDSVPWGVPVDEIINSMKKI